MDRNELVSELLPRLRRLRGPGEGGAGNDAERYWETMPRSNEPAAGFRRPDQPVSERDIRQMAAEPATQFNMNAATAAEGRIKGIEGLVVQLDPERAIEVRERQVKEGVTPTTRSIATEMLETQPRRQQALRRHLEGPPWAGSRKGWIEPGEAATAMAAALRGPARDEVSGPAAAAVWSHVDRDLLEACAVGEDYDAYIRAVAEDRIGAERNGTDEERERAVDREEQRLQEAFAPTLVAATAAVDRGATIGSGVRIGADAVVDWGACIGVVPTDLRGALLGDQEETERQVTTVGTGAHIGTHCQVERGSAVGEHARVGEYGNVRSVGARSTVGRHSWCHGNVGSDSTIGNRTVVHGVGDRSEVGGGCNVGAAIGHDVRIGRDTNINMEADGTAGPKDRERELLITDGSDIGDEVRAPHGWRPTEGPVRIAPETTIGKGVAIPPQRTMPGSEGAEEVVFGPGELTTPEAVARILERAEVPPQVGRDCRIHPTAFVGAGARIGDRTTIHAGAVVQAGAEIGRDSTIKTGASVGIAARIGPENTIGERAKAGHGAHTGRGCVIGPEAEVRENVTAGDHSRIDGRVLAGAGIGAHSEVCWKAMVGDDARIGAETRVGEGATVRPRAEVGNGVHIADNASVMDEATVRDGASLGPGTKVEMGRVVETNERVRSTAHPATAPPAATGETGRTVEPAGLER